MKRPTIRDIAKETGVSVAAVSFALNGKPGISEQTRKRILDAAADIGWSPNITARALSHSKAGAMGMFIARQADSYVSERFFFDFIIGVQKTLTTKGFDLVMHNGSDIADEVAAYKKWRREGRVDGVILVDPRVDDPRADVLTSLELPGVFVGEHVAGHSAVITNDSDLVSDIATHLAEIGARRIGFVSGMPSITRTVKRIEALEDFGAASGIDVVISSGTDFTERSGYGATREFLRLPSAPDAIIFDNEILALGGMNAIGDAGVSAGRDIAVVSCEDSQICRVLNPSITSVRRDPGTLGSLAAQLLFSIHESGAVKTVTAEKPELVLRETTKLFAPSHESSNLPTGTNNS